MVKSVTVCFLIAGAAISAERPLLWRDPGPIESLDFVGGPGGAANAPQPPFTFVDEPKAGITPKVVATDGRGAKWMVKFGPEAKAETFASRIAWAAGYPVPASYYVAEGRLQGVKQLGRTSQYIDGSGAFHGARFEKWYDASFQPVKGTYLDLEDSGWPRREASGLKLTLLLLANSDIKRANTGYFDIDGKRYAIVSDWGSTLGDPASGAIEMRKWDCRAFADQTTRFIDGVDGDTVRFSSVQYAGIGERAMSSGIHVEDLKWYMARMGKLTDDQIRTALRASGASDAETACFTRVMRDRLNLFAALARGEVVPGSGASKTTTTTTKKTTTRTVREH